jgi:two-component system, NtrC family, sensor histidine kinase PilS
MEQQQVLKRLKLFLVFRLLIAITGLVAIWSYQKGQLVFPPHIRAIYFIFILACLVTIVYLILIKYIRSLFVLRIISVLQVGIDLLLISGLCYFTGGISSVFAYLYFVVILATAFLISGQASLVFASLATILLSTITLAYTISTKTHWILPFIPEKYILATAQEIKFILPYLFFFGLSLHIVAWLAGRLTIELASEKILKSDILHNMLHGLIVTNRKGIVNFWNPKASEMLRLSTETRLTDNRIERILSDSKYKTLLSAISDTNNRNLTLEFIDRTGEPIYLEINISVLKDKHQLPRGMITVLSDITFKKRMEGIMKQGEHLQSLQEMSASLAHEIRNPLASIKSAIQALQTYSGNPLKPNENKLMDLVLKESDRLNKIVSNFLEFASKKSVVPQRIYLNDLLNDVTLLLKQTQKPVTITTLLTEQLYCSGDPVRLKQLLLNLGLNALEASFANGSVTFKGCYASQKKPLESLSLDTSKYTKNSILPEEIGITLEIIDQGSGIKEEILNRIFEPFFTTKAKGIGLGLSIASKIVQEHKGHIWCVPNIPPPGTRFIVWLPAHTSFSESKTD